MWLSHFRLLSTKTPSSLYTRTRSIGWPLHTSCDGGFAFAPIIISFVFDMLTFIRFSADQSNTSPKNVSMWLSQSLPIISDKVVSSTNLCIIHPVDRSSIRTIKISGPSHDPWGIAPFSDSQSEKNVGQFNSLAAILQEGTNPPDQNIRNAKFAQFTNDDGVIDVVEGLGVVDEYSSNCLLFVDSLVPMM